MVGPLGIEPRTACLKGRCSTTELGTRRRGEMIVACQCRVAGAAPLTPRRLQSAREARMRPASIIGILLIVGGLAALLMGGFSFTRSEKVLDVGPLEATVETRERVPLPPIVGGIALAAGVALLLLGNKSRA